MAKEKKTFVLTGGSLLIFIFVIAIVLPMLLKSRYSAEALPLERFASSESGEIEVIHLETPKSLKSLYMTACVAATPSWRNSLKEIVDNTELNAVIIDIKDYSGNLSYNGNVNCKVADLKEFIAELHENDIYVIGRITVFQDPYYANLHPELAVKSKSTGSVWRDNKGLSFIDVGAKPFWDYIIEISRTSHDLGFDELNFDYIRYPSDGSMQDANYTWMDASSTKAEMLENFFIYLHKSLKDTTIGGGEVPVISADLFGMTTTTSSDMGIGQILEKTLPYFDYVAPMVYPSHYPSGWNGLSHPAANPYEVVHIAMSEGKRREEVLNVS